MPNARDAVESCGKSLSYEVKRSYFSLETEAADS